ncbi:MAG: hypothetical protein ACK5JF_02775 [Oscillospiraceae bacterium]
MKFKNKETGSILSPKTDFAAEQLKKDPRFMMIEGKKEEDSGSGEGAADGLEKMKKEDLLTLAAEKGIEVSAQDSKEKILAAIKAALPAE